jgi:tRNA A-37 threonylcarbamoyl transferase component Bud32
VTDDDTSPLPPLVDGRYRVDQLLGTSAASTTWLGFDERLLRPVRLHVPIDPCRLTDALATARVAHPSLLAAVDVCRQPVVLVTEHVTGRPLATRAGPWPWPEAVRAMSAVGDAVATLHEVGLAHGSLSIDSIELGPDGRLVVGDCLARPDPDGAVAAADVTSLSRLLAALVTGLDGPTVDTLDALDHVQPSPPDELVELVAASLAADGDGGERLSRDRTPGDADSDDRADVGRDRDGATDIGRDRDGATDDRDERTTRDWAQRDRATYQPGSGGPSPVPSPVPRDGGEWVRRLRALHNQGDGQLLDPEEAGAGEFVRRERVWFIPALVVVALGLALAVAGLVGGSGPVGRRIIEGAREAVGLREPAPVDTSAQPSPTTTPAGGDEGITPLPIAAIVDFDPGGDGVEHPDRLAMINDDNPAEGWYTEKYTTRDFGGLKEGLGLIVRLDAPVPLAALVVDSPNSGWSAQVHTSDAGLPDRLEDWGPVKGSTSAVAGQAQIDLDGSAASSVLLWITDLGEQTSDGFRFIVTAITAVGPEPG